MSIRAVLKLITRFIFWVKGYRIHSGEHLPKKRQACILIANHAAFVDSIYLIASVRPRFTICGAKPKYFRKWPIRQLFQIANILKVESHEQFLKDCRLLLRSGEVILVYPEMGRNPDAMGPFQTWAAEVALAEKVQVIPCYLYGTTNGQSGKKRLIVGSPIEPQGNAESLTQMFRESILSLKPDKQA
ncbi:1-acyl-sn-glycerol-3-phosphate acyltransferase [candidate division KSB1 bacterium]|nr:1-acyl-sn-glycerol-3-phosphate acyltransferase [candidate division KSB1 bacterium]